MARPDTPQALTFFEAILPVASLVVLVGLSYYLFGDAGAAGPNGVVEKAGVLEKLIAPVIQATKSVGALVASLVAAAIATNVITADQYIAIVLPGRMFKTAFERRGLAPLMLSRTIAAAGTPTSALIPWNSCGAYMAGTLGIATLHYAPYAVFNIASPLLTIAITATGLLVLHASPRYRGTAVPHTPPAGKS